MSAAATAVEWVLRQLSADQVRELAAAAEPCDRPPDSLAGAVRGGTPVAVDAVTRLVLAWRATPELSGAGVALALRVGLAASERADRRQVRPVWTGPEAKGNQRLTAAVLHELIAGARARILLVSFAAHTVASVAADLRGAAERGVGIDVVFETARDSDGGYDAADDRPFGDIVGIRRWRWPAERRARHALLHAKALVIDGRRALVGSANLTHRALTANLELGVLIDDPAVAGAIELHVKHLVDAGVMVQLDR